MTVLNLFRDRERRYLLLSGSLTFLVLGLSQAMYGPFYPHFREIYSLSASATGMIASFHFAGATVAVAISGVAAGRFGFRPVITAGGLLFTGGFLGVALSGVWTGILFSALLLGFGFGTLVVYNLFVDDYFGRLGPAALNLINMFFGIGSILSPILAGVSMSLGDHRLGFLVGGALAMTAFVLSLRLPRRTPPQETDQSRAGVAMMGTGTFLLLFVLYIGAESTSSNWIPTSLARLHPAAVVASVTSLFWLALSAGRLVAMPLSIRITPPVMVIGAGSLSAATALIARIDPLAIPAYILTGFFLGPFFPAAISWIRRSFPTRAARITPLVLAGGGIGGIVFPPLVGTTVDRFGVPIIPVALGAILILGMTTALVIARYFPDRVGTMSSVRYTEGET